MKIIFLKVVNSEINCQFFCCFISLKVLKTTIYHIIQLIYDVQTFNFYLLSYALLADTILHFIGKQNVYCNSYARAHAQSGVCVCVCVCVCAVSYTHLDVYKRQVRND